MKQLIILFPLFLCITICAQTTTGKVKWVRSTLGNYIYTGELLNGKPDGIGLAISTSSGDSLIFGQFKNGMLEGRVVIRYSNGILIVAPFKENVIQGMTIIVTIDKHFSYGPFTNGKMDGKMIVVQSNNTINIGQARSGTYHGRVLEIPSDGKILYDNMYLDNVKNGQGYQYETKNKQLFEGIWENEEWVRATTGNYPSFLRNKNLGSSITSDRILIFSDIIRTSNNSSLQDTCFTYDIKDNNRLFGHFDHGRFTSGIRILGDSIRMIGQYGEGNQREGFGIDCKLDKYLIMGNFKNGDMDGPGISVDLDDSTIYDGIFTEGYFTGSAARLLKNKQIKIGNFIKGNLDGKGKTIFPDGRSVSGEYEDGELSLISITEVIKPDGKKINHEPKDVSTAVNFLLKEWENNFSNINSEDYSDNTKSDYYSWYSFPNGFDKIVPDVPGINGKPHHEYSSEIAEHSYYDLIKSIYDRLCKEIAACTITSLAKGRSLKLTPKINKLPADGAFEGIASFFTIPAYVGKKSDPQVRVMVRNTGDAYRLTVDIISKQK